MAAQPPLICVPVAVFPFFLSSPPPSPQKSIVVLSLLAGIIICSSQTDTQSATAPGHRMASDVRRWPSNKEGHISIFLAKIFNCQRNFRFLVVRTEVRGRKSGRNRWRMSCLIQTIGRRLAGSSSVGATAAATAASGGGTGFTCRPSLIGVICEMLFSVCSAGPRAPDGPSRRCAPPLRPPSAGRQGSFRRLTRAKVSVA